MKKALLIIFCLILPLILTADVPKELQKIINDAPDLRELSTPPMERFTLPNGLEVMVMEDHRLPLIAGSFMYRGGSVFDPAEKVGLAGVATEVLRTGGTTNLTGDEIDEILESKSASIEAYASKESAKVSFNCLKENFDEVIALFRDVMLTPEFREDKLQLAKDQYKSGISRRNDEPSGIAHREFARLLYGDDNPYARIEEYATIDAITRDDLLQYHKKYLFPSNGILAIWGDVNAKTIKKSLKTLFTDWKDRGRTVPEYPAIDDDLNSGLYFSQKEGVNQSYIKMGHFGIQRDNPDYYALEVMNRIFGMGGFASRLFKEIRSAKGLTYGVYGGVDWEFTHRGAFFISTFTGSGKTVDAVNACVEEIEKIKTDGVTEAELKRAKKAFFEKFVFNFDTVDKIINKIQAYVFYGYPENYLEILKKKIEAVSVEDVNRVAAKYMHPENMIIYVVGQKDIIDPPLSELGTVQIRDITIPEPEGEKAPEASKETLEKGQKLMQLALKAHGGDAVLKVNAVKIKQTIAIQGMTLNSTMTAIYPGKIHVLMTMPQGSMEQVYNGEKAWMKMGENVQVLPAEDFKESISHDFFYLFKAFRDGKATVQLGEPEIVGETKADVVYAAVDGVNIKIYLFPEDHRLAGMKYQGKTQMGPAEMFSRYSEYKEVGGVLYPHKAEIQAGGQDYLSITVEQLTLNPDMDESLFMFPEGTE